MQLSFKKTPLHPNTNSRSVIMIKLAVLQLLTLLKSKRKTHARY